jgi:hypothetical protein
MRVLEKLFAIRCAAATKEPCSLPAPISSSLYVLPHSLYGGLVRLRVIAALEGSLRRPHSSGDGVAIAAGPGVQDILVECHASSGRTVSLSVSSSACVAVSGYKLFRCGTSQNLLARKRRAKWYTNGTPAGGSAGCHCALDDSLLSILFSAISVSRPVYVSATAGLDRCIRVDSSKTSGHRMRAALSSG